MPEQSTTGDPIRTAFAELRGSEQTRTIAPPGVAAAYRTVRHRRRRAAVTAAAGLTAVLLLGGGYLAGLGAAGPERNDTVPAPTVDRDAAAQPTDGAPDAGAQRLSELAVAGLGPAPDPERLGVIVAGSPGDRAAGPEWGFELHDDRAGEYELRIACAGTGGVTVTIRSGREEATATAECGTTAEEVAAGRGQASLAADGRIQAVEQPDADAQSGAVWAIALDRVGA